MITNGILAMPFLFGVRPFLRLLEVKNHHDLENQKVKEQGEHGQNQYVNIGSSLGVGLLYIVDT